ncbi:MAG: hemagglutinin, partial [Anaerolineae bacterium]|nr:hemagglutinin [Anaerolineae bacterium]MDW8070199.1 hemagglutinin [Anaerolineae bacterium]
MSRRQQLFLFVLGLTTLSVCITGFVLVVDTVRRMTTTPSMVAAQTRAQQLELLDQPVWLSPTPTATPTPSPTPTYTLVPTWTPEPTATFTPAPTPTETPVPPTPTPRPQPK